jgi:hypothetical protein
MITRFGKLFSLLTSVFILISLVALDEAHAVDCSESVANFAQLQTAFTNCTTSQGGVITVTADIDTTARLLYSGSGNLTIQSNQIGTLRRLRATGSVTWAVIESSSGPITIDSLEITGGNATGTGFYGGGVQGWNKLTIRNSYIHDNYGRNGGGTGLGNTSGTVQKEFYLDYSRIESNTANSGSFDSGGGFYSPSSGSETVTVNGSSFAYNVSTRMGAALNMYVNSTSSVYTFTNTTFSQNVTSANSGSYGAIAFNYGSLKLYFSTFYQNKNTYATQLPDIYCGASGSCSANIVGTAFLNDSASGTCYGSSSNWYATYSISNIAAGAASSCLNNRNSSGVVNSVSQATNTTSTLVNTYLSSTPALNSAKTLTHAISNSSSSLLNFVPSSVGSLYTTIDQRGLARSGTNWTVGAYDYNAVPILTSTTNSLSLAAGNIYYKAAKNISSSSNSIVGKVTFYANGKRISKCISMPLNGANSYTATCSWIPTTKGSVVLTSIFTPADTATYATSRSTPVYVGVAKRVTTR